MRKFKLTVIAIVMLAVAGCTSKTEFGDCIGAFDDKDPTLTYKMSANNLFWAVIGSSLIVPPILVVVNETFCPVGIKVKKD